MEEVRKKKLSYTRSWKDLSSNVYEGMEIIHPVPFETMDYNDNKLGGKFEPPEKGSYQSFMEKDIFDQPESIRKTFQGRVDFANHRVTLRGIEPHIDEILRCRRLLMIGAGSSYHCAIGTRQIIEELTELPVMVELASDFLDREVPVFRDDVCIFISQSGETSSTLQALRYCKQRDAFVMGITNSVNSTLSRDTFCGLHANAGVEVGISSTKAYVSQFLALVLFGLLMAEDKVSKQERIREIIDEIKVLPDKILQILNQANYLREAAKKYKDKKSMLVMGRGYQHASCLEGAFKLKEVAYLHSEGILAGELKHGTLALVDQEMPIIMIVTKDGTFDKTMNAVQQVIARKGNPLFICDDAEIDVIRESSHYLLIPRTSDCLQGILSVVPMQMLAMYLALLRGHDVDRPRNLVKTVTDQD